MQETEEQLSAILDHLLAGGDSPPFSDSGDPLVQKLHALARDRIEVREGTRAFSYLSTISHELRTPLNAIIGYSELLLEDVSAYEPDEVESDVRRIHNAGRHLLGLINEVVEVAHIESGRAKLKRRAVQLDPLVAELLPSVMQTVRKRNNKFHWEVAPKLRVWTDGAKLRTILRTLLHRAARVTQDGRIDLRVQVVEAGLRIEVEDTGSRVSPENLAQTFHPFNGGAGTGLTSTARLVELIGGEIQFESTAQGGRFQVTLPLVQDLSDEEDPLPVVPDGKPIVLFVHRDQSTAQLGERFLSGLDCVVMQSDSSSEALRITEAVRPSVIVVEGDAGPDGGWDLLGSLKSNPDLATIPVVMVSGGDADPALGADDYLTKPFDRKTMVNAVARLITAGQRQRVLVVDDEPDARELARRVLASVGYVVDEVADGRAALDYLERERPDLILLDLMMPEMDGFEVIQALKKRPDLAEIPVLVLTAMTLTDEDREVLQSRARSVVTKGTAPSALLDRISAVLDRRG